MTERSGYSEVEVRLARVRTEDLADALEVTPAQASRLKNGENGVTADKIGSLLTFLGLSVYPQDREVVTMPREEAEALRIFACKGVRGG